MDAQQPHQQTSRTRRRVLPVVAVFGVAATAVTAVSLWPAGPAARPAPAVHASSGPAGAGRPAPTTLDAELALSTHRSCDQLAAWFRERARAQVTAYGLDATGSGYATRRDLIVPAAAEASTTAAAAGSSGTGTNVQVGGVDEADLAKRSGDLLLVARSGYSADTGQLVVLRTGAGPAKVTGRLTVTGWTPEQLLVSGRTVLLIGTRGGGPVIAASGVVEPDRSVRGPRPQTSHVDVVRDDSRPRTVVAQVDVSDPVHPRLVRTLTVTGSVTGARQVGSHARLVVVPMGSALPVTYSDGTPAGDRQALAANRAAVARSGVDDWLPQYRLHGATGRDRTGRLVPCEQVAVPDGGQGLSAVTLLDLDLAAPGGIGDWRSGAAVLTGGTTVYATADRTYLASPVTRTLTQGRGTAAIIRMLPTRTDLYAFDTPPGAVPRFAAAGSVPGTLLDQYSLDESGGALRVATTTGQGGPIIVDGRVPVDMAPMPTRPPTAGRASTVAVLRQSGERLETVGSVGGLGRGETVMSVRFAGDVGYVVTYRQTDPLFVIDLRDATRPRLAGKLTVPGYSAYLHPAGDGTLLGVGQDGTGGLQLALFDVRDPAHPRRVDRVDLPDRYWSAEGDEHAFTWTGAAALVPYVVQTGPGGGVLSLPVDGQSFGPARTLRLPAGVTVAYRTFEQDGTVWVTSDEGVATFTPSGSRTWAAF